MAWFLSSVACFFVEMPSSLRILVLEFTFKDFRILCCLPSRKSHEPASNLCG